MSLVLLLWSGVPLGAQEEGGVPVFLDRVDVNLVNVEVMVTDRGKPVTGLGRDDFEIYDDGQPMQITNFYAVEGGQRNAEEEELVGGEAGASIDGAVQQSFIVVLVDNTFIGPVERKQVFQELRRRLDELLFEGAQVMVVNKDRTVQIEQRVTADRSEIEAALDRIERRGAMTGMQDAGERLLLRQIAQGSSPTPESAAGASGAAGFGVADPAEQDAAMFLGQAHAYASQVFQDVRRSMLGIRHFLNSLAGMPGRKAVLYVADGLPVRAGELIFRTWFEKYGARFGADNGIFSVEEAIVEYDSSQELVDLIADANSNRVAFYPISSGKSPVLEGLSARGGDANQTASFALMGQQPETQSLRLLARGTGGWVATEVNNFDGLLEQLEQDLTGYYSLGFLSPHEGDGDVHKIRVRVKREGVQLRYLESYRDKDPDQRMVDRTLSALLMDAEANPLQAWVEVGETTRQSDGRYLVPIQVKFPIANLALLPQETSHIGSVSIFVAVRDDRGRVSEPQKVPLPVTIPNESILSAMSQAAAYVTKIRLRAGEQVLGVGVRDDYANVGSTIKVRLNVGEDV